MQSWDGNLVLYHEGRALWSAGAAGAGAYLAMQTDGNMVVYNGSSAAWNSSTWDFSGAFLQVQDDGNVVIYQDGHPIWDWQSGYLGGELNQWQLEPGAFLLSPNHQYELVMQASDGNLVLYHEGKALWASGAAGAGSHVVMQTDGNLVIYNSSSAAWNSNTSGFFGAYMQVQDDGNVVVYQDGHPIWDWGSGYIGNELNQWSLGPGAFLLSPDHQYQLVMQASDGNLVLYHEGSALWNTGPEGAGASVTMQTDGNLVVYNGGVAKWNSETAGFPGAYLALQNDSNLVIYQGSTAIWDWESGRLGGGGGGGGGNAIVAAAESQANRPYCFDGGNEFGPTHGAGNEEGASQCGPGSTVGFDCTGLTQYAAYQGTGGAVDLTHHNSQQAEYAPGQWITSESALQPGDIVYFGYSRDDITHAGIYAGVVGGQQMIWDANIAFWIYPDGVHERTLASENGLGFVGAARV